MLTRGSVTSGLDSIIGGSGDAQTLYGDGVRIQGSAILTAGRDTITVNNVTNRSTLVGDVGQVRGASFLGNADTLTGSATMLDTIIGDVDFGAATLVQCGNDTIDGRGGSDFSIGDIRTLESFDGGLSRLQSGADVIKAGDGNDTVVGDVYTIGFVPGAGRHTVFTGNDRIFGDEGNDKLYGDTIFAPTFVGYGKDTIFGGNGDDEIDRDLVTQVTNAGNDDILDGGRGNDRVSGGGGHDICRGGDGDDVVYGDIASRPNAPPPTGSYGPEGGIGNDRLFGGGGKDLLLGGDGHDQLFGDDVPQVGYPVPKINWDILMVAPATIGCSAARLIISASMSTPAPIGLSISRTILTRSRFPPPLVSTARGMCWG